MLSQQRDFNSPNYAFDPNDPWTKVFQEGLARANLQNKSVYEVGLGTGANVAYLLAECNASHVSGSDVDKRLTELASKNLFGLYPEYADKFEPIFGSISLINNPKSRKWISNADAIVACLPQVGDPYDERLSRIYREFRTIHTVSDPINDDHYAHYYPWSEFDSFPYNAVGLGLNQALLEQIKECAPETEIILNFGCRIGIDVIEDFFIANGYIPDVLSSQVVRQHRNTKLEFFVALEQALWGTDFEGKFSCEFFKDSDANKRITAEEAYNLQAIGSDTPLYHKVCVVRGIPLKN